MSSETSYSAQWKEYDRRANLIVWMLLLIIPVIGLIGIPLSYLADSPAPAMVTVFVWFIAVIFTIGYRNNWQCPRCGKAFFWKWTHRNTFASKCVHCGLPKYAKSDMDAGTEEIDDKD